jgi:hypothetical protein
VRFEQRLAELCVDSGVMEFPRRNSDRHILWKSILVGVDPVAQYSEKEIDEHILHWLTTIGRTISRDHVNIRRQLIDEGYPTRTPDCSVYRYAVTGPGHKRFDAGVENVDCKAVIRKRLLMRTHKRREFLKRRFRQKTQASTEKGEEGCTP